MMVALKTGAFMMKRSIVHVLAATACVVAITPAFAAGGGKLPYSFDPELGNEASLQRGAKYFMNYCSGCHGLEYLRYNRMAEDLDIPEDLLNENLIFSDAKPGEHMHTAMPSEAAGGWFGQAPPDLTLTARSKGPSWIYSFLLSFHLDDSKPMGTNNTVLAGASMPHVLWPLEGFKKLDTHGDDHGGASDAGGHGGDSHGSEFVQVTEGELDKAGYRQVVSDITNFLTYAAEPGKRDRIALGAKVITYLILLFVLAYLLKREYWKDVH